MTERVRVLFDATRLSTRGALLPTGIDRVDLAYVNALSTMPGVELQLMRFGLAGPALLSEGAAERLAQRWERPAASDGEALLGWLAAPPGTPAPERESSAPEFQAQRVASLVRNAFDFPAQSLRLAGELARERPTVYVNTSHGQLYRRGVADWLRRTQLPSVFFVHDLIPIEFPEYNRRGEADRHARRVHTIATLAKAVLVNSEATQEALRAHLTRRGLSAPPIEVLPLGVQAGVTPDAAALPRVQVPYFAIVSTIEPRKNHRLLLETWRELVDTMGNAAPRLVIVGRRGWENRDVFKQLDALAPSPHVAEVSGLSDAALSRVLAGATAVLSPSFAEGYGLPVAEALALGTPVIASDLAAHREVADGRAEFLDPRDRHAWRTAIVEHSKPNSARNAALRKLAAGFQAPGWSTHMSRAVAVLRAAALGAGLATLAACGNYLPSAGPLRSDIRDEGASRGESFVLVDVDAQVLSALKAHPGTGFAAAFGEGGAPPDLSLGAGDGVSITIYEAGTQPLFAGGQGRASTLPEQIVERDGSINIPYAGRIQVAGKSLRETQTAIEQALSGKTSRPQVLVALTRNVSNSVTVLGEAAAGGRVPLSPRGDRLLDLLATNTAGRAATFETRVTLTRGGVRASLPLSAVLADPAENIYLKPGDLLAVTREPQSFTAFGATGRNAQIPFDTARVTLVEAVAKAGGLQDARADPQGVFLFRRESGELAQQVGGAKAPAGSAVPVVYQVDLTRAGGYFLARDFELRDGDVLYVASAPANELTKFLQLLGLATQPAANGAIIDSAVRR